MADLFKAFFFKLRKDLTFRITLIVGGGVAILMMLLYMAIDGGGGHVYCSGNNLFVTSFNPAQNFGLAIPINLITFTVTEFGFGIIRNKIVAGNSKLKIYLSLFLTGIVFSLSLLFAYVGLSTLLGTIVGGFDPNGRAILGLTGIGFSFVSGDFLWKFLIANIFVYITFTAVIIFFSCLLRNVGPCIPITILFPILLCTVLPIISQIPDVRDSVGDALIYLNPFQVIGNPETTLVIKDYPNIGEMWEYHYSITNTQMIGTTICNVVWTLLFTGFGTLIFVKRDVK